jgi:AP-4 complex subunit mu-1
MLDGVNYIHVKIAGLFFVVTTMVKVSPSLLPELLQRIACVTKDYLGILNEDSLWKNFILVFELLDEVVVSTLHHPTS